MSKINNDIILFGSVESSLSAIKSIRKSKYGNLKCLVTTRNKNNNSDYIDLTLHVEDDVQVIFIEDFSINEICSVIELNNIKILVFIHSVHRICLFGHSQNSTVTKPEFKGFAPQCS